MDAKDVTPEMHDEFYRFIGTSYDRPRFTLHYKTDAPLTLRALLYFPEGKPGMQKLVTNFSCTYYYVGSENTIFWGAFMAVSVIGVFWEFVLCGFS
jgi:hypothetical protein